MEAVTGYEMIVYIRTQEEYKKLLLYFNEWHPVTTLYYDRFVKIGKYTFHFTYPTDSFLSFEEWCLLKSMDIK